MEFAPNYQHNRPMSPPAFLPVSRQIPTFLVLVSTTYSCFHTRRRLQSVINRLSVTVALFLFQIHQQVSNTKKTCGALYSYALKVLDDYYTFSLASHIASFQRNNSFGLMAGTCFRANSMSPISRLRNWIFKFTCARPSCLSGP